MSTSTTCIAIGSLRTVETKSVRCFYFGEDVDYETIKIGKLDVTALVREVESLRNEVDFLKESLSRVLAEESLRDVEEIITEKNPE